MKTMQCYFKSIRCPHKEHLILVSKSFLIPLKKIPCVNLINHIAQHAFVIVCVGFGHGQRGLDFLFRLGKGLAHLVGHHLADAW